MYVFNNIIQFPYPNHWDIDQDVSSLPLSHFIRELVGLVKMFALVVEKIRPRGYKTSFMLDTAELRFITSKTDVQIFTF